MAKSVRLDVRLADWEMDLLRGMAKDRGLDLSAFVRSVLFEGAARVAEGAVYPVGKPTVIAAPAREVPLPPVKRRRNMSTADARAVQEFAEKSYPKAACEFALPPPPEILAVSEEDTKPANVIMAMRDVPDDAALNALPLESIEDDISAVESAFGELVQFPKEPPTLASMESPAEIFERAKDGALVDLVEKSRPSPPPENGASASTAEIAGIPEFGGSKADDSAPIPLPGPDVVSAGPMTAAFSKPKRKFTRSTKCASDKCERLQSPTCDACRKANADSVVAEDVVPVSQPTKAWKTGKRAPTCITAKCGQLGAACCEPCRKFNARGFDGREIEF